MNDPKKFAAIFLECSGRQYEIIAIEFHTDDEKDAQEIAQDIALLEGSELIYLAKKE
jgi:hypothetical protein